MTAPIERKLAKASYQELLEKYGYGTQVVGMPLWFAVPSNDPCRAENALDDFMTRTALGLEEVRRGGAEETGLTVPKRGRDMGHEPAGLARMAKREIGRVRRCGWPKRVPTHWPIRRAIGPTSS